MTIRFKKKTKKNENRKDLTIIVEIVDVSILLRSLSLLLFSLVKFFSNFATRLFCKYFIFFFFFLD